DYVVNLQNIPQPFEEAILLPPEIFETYCWQGFLASIAEFARISAQGLYEGRCFASRCVFTSRKLRSMYKCLSCGGA
ncbi:MAG TPA: hypothetical protein VK211_17450, partial [Kamptonema sp.]|nr:hypothetical protein [Kamptonema sp.]